MRQHARVDNDNTTTRVSNRHNGHVIHTIRATQNVYRHYTKYIINTFCVADDKGL
jgi:hypothetical protein